MKQLEAFTLGKIVGQPEANEDSLVIVPGRGYAVIDGVTARNETRYGTMRPGQFASRTVQKAAELYILAQGDASQPALQYRGAVPFISYLTQALRDAYAAQGQLEAVTADPRLRGGCTIMAALVIRMGRSRSGPASRMACRGDSPCSRTRTIARSTSRMAFLVTSPISRMIPIIEPMAIVLLVTKSPRMAPTSASGSVSMMVSG